jgi:CHAT domain-containing protein
VNDLLPDSSHLVLAQDTLPSPHDRPPTAKAYDGRLTVETIRRDWDLDADLVVLSACRTALGREAQGDGLLGFAHAFLARGARCVVLSRWKVDDGATALLMVRFYENLLGKRGKKMGRAQALREAKGWLRALPRAEAGRRLAHLTKGTLRGSEGELPPLKKGDTRPALPKGDRPYEHPFYWAAWALVGDPD